MPVTRGPVFTHFIFRHFVFFLFLFAVSPLFAQSGSTSGTLNGTVMDGTGAVVPGAKVSIENPVSGYTRSVVSDPAGRYQFPNVRQWL